MRRILTAQPKEMKRRNAQSNGIEGRQARKTSTGQVSSDEKKEKSCRREGE